jgi:hypothetical protein
LLGIRKDNNTIYISANNTENNNTNIIVVPQNIYSQWILSIEKFSKNLTYNKFITYDNIISLYTKPDLLSNTDIIITTSSYYHIIATTLVSLNIKINRVFFDEIDSISNIISTKINANFIWFVSASFNVNYLGYYGNKINDIDLNNITCKCETEFIDENIYLEKPLKTYYLCKNIYIDNILEYVVSKNELKNLNAMDYTLNNKDFEQNKVKNEKELIDLILKNRRSIIEFNKFQINDSDAKINYFTNCIDNIETYDIDYCNKIKTLNNINDFKEEIIKLVLNFNDFISINVFKDELRKKGIQSLKISLDDIIDLCYNINNINIICEKHYNNKRSSIEIDMIIMNIKKILVLVNTIIKNLNDIKNEDTEIYILFNILEQNKNYFDDLLIKINNYSDSLIASSQIEIYKKHNLKCNII